MTRRAVIAGVILVAAIGCGRSEQDQAEQAAQQLQEGAEALARGAEQMAQGAQANSEQMAQGLQQMAQGFQQMAQGQGNPVPYEDLKALLPQVNGWTQSNARGEELSMPIKYARAQARYARGDSSVDLEITDSAMSQMLLAPISMFMASGFSERSDDGFKRSAKISGYPGMEEWNVNSKRGEVTLLVADRFMVQATGRDVADLAAVNEVIAAIDLSKLAGLK